MRYPMDSKGDAPPKFRDLVGGSTDIAHVHKSFVQSLGQGCMFPHGNALCTRPWAY